MHTKKMGGMRLQRRGDRKVNGRGEVPLGGERVLRKKGVRTNQGVKKRAVYGVNGLESLAKEQR